MAPQTDYPTSIPKAFAGMKANSTGDTVRSYVNAEASAEMPFGAGVMLGDADNRAKLPAAGDTAAKFAGVVVHSHSYHVDALGDVGVKPKQMVSVMEEGDINVQVEEAVVRGDRAFLRIANGAGGTQEGAWRKSADTATAIEIKGCYFLESGGIGDVVKMRVSRSAAKAAV